MDEIPDEELVAQYQQGQQAALTALYRRYYSYAYKIFLCKGVPPAEAEDFTQDIFLKLTRTLPNFAARSSFKTYLDRALTHKLIDFYRTRPLRPLPLHDAVFELLEFPPFALPAHKHFHARLPNPAWEANELGELLRQCLEKNANVAARAILALWLDGFKLRQIAQLLSLPQGTVNSLQARGRLRLRKCLESRFTD